MENKPIKIGDLVELNSGSPCMTVTEVHASGTRESQHAGQVRVTVTWIGEHGQPCSTTLPVECLMRRNPYRPSSLPSSKDE